MVLHKLHTLVEAAFVKPVQVGQMDFEPAQSGSTQRLLIRKLEKTSTQVVANVVKMWRNGVGSPSEVDIVREVELVGKELLKFV